MTYRLLTLVVVLGSGLAALALSGDVDAGDPAVDPLGRCCFVGIVPEPVLCDVLTERDCLSLAAPVSWTEGEDCAGDPCNAPPPPIGRCCFQGIVADPLLCDDQLTEMECFSLAAPVSWTEGDTCDGDPCNQPSLGRCCYVGIIPEPVLCDVTTEEACFFFAGALSWTAGEDCAGDPCNECPADCARPGDGLVGITDLLALLSQVGGPGSCDTDGSGVVNVVDLLELLASWGPCPGVGQ